MITLASVQKALTSGTAPLYACQENLNLYDSPQLERLATQAVAGRQLRVETIAEGHPAVRVVLCEDGYPGWVAIEDLDLLEERGRGGEGWMGKGLTPEEIGDRIPQVLEFVQNAMRQPNYYLWGGTVGPNYDCSGLVQTAFAAAGIWLPRDAYQQEAFVQAIALADLRAGDLIFFGTPERCTHVGIYLGEGQYIHSSGKDQGRNGIGVDVLSENGDAVSVAYFRQLRGVGRVVACYTARDG
jgi:cell wall-associated NlpC family hydrolase